MIISLLCKYMEGYYSFSQEPRSAGDVFVKLAIIRKVR